MELEEILSKLLKLKKTRRGWTACCPAHSDRNPSLSINEDNEKILMFCHAGCSFEEIIQALEQEETKPIEANHFQGRIADDFKKIVATYDYVDERGELLFQAIKFDPKSFAFKQPNKDKGWIWTLKGARRVPYHLPEILQARESKKPVFICEGEKDADNLRTNFGLTATTTALGSNGWTPAYADYFKDLDVIILPDNEIAGQKYATAIASSLTNLATSVKIVNLPNLTNKGDVSDWIQNGGNKAELINLIKKTSSAIVKSTVRQKANSELVNFFIVKLVRDVIKEAKAKPIPKMLFGELWFEGEICILFADANVGKSILAVQIGNSITKAIPIDNFKLGVAAQKVLYFDFELTERQFSLRYCEQNVDKIINEYDFSENFSRAEINPDGDFGRVKFEDALFSNLESYLAKSDIKIVIIDNLTYLKSDTEQAKDASSLMQKLKSIKNKFDLSVLVLAHTPKRHLSREISINDLAGSKMLMNFCDSAFSIGKSFADEKVRYIKQIKERNTEKIYGSDNVVNCRISKNKNFLSFQITGCGSEREHLASKNSRVLEDEIEIAKSLSRQGNSQRAIAKKMNLSVGKVNGLLNSSITSSDSDIQSVQTAHKFS